MYGFHKGNYFAQPCLQTRSDQAQSATFFTPALLTRHSGSSNMVLVISSAVISLVYARSNAELQGTRSFIATPSRTRQRCPRRPRPPTQWRHHRILWRPD